MSAEHYRAFLLRYLEAGFGPVSEEDLYSIKNGNLEHGKGWRGLFVYHDMDLWQHDHTKAMETELELGIVPHFMIHHPDDRRNRVYDAHEKVKLLRAHPGVKLCWHVNPYDHDRKELTAEELMGFRKVLDQHVVAMREFIGTNFRSCTIHGDPARFNLTPAVLDHIELEHGIFSIDRARQEGSERQTDLVTAYTSDSGGRIKREIPPNSKGLVFLNFHCGNYDIDEVAKAHLEHLEERNNLITRLMEIEEGER